MYDDHSFYSPFTRDELHAAVGGSKDEFTEALASLIQKGIVNEHHDGGFTFNPEYVEFLLSQHPKPETDTGSEDVWLG